MDDLWKVAIGIVVGVTAAFAIFQLMRQTSFTQFVRDDSGQIVQIIEMHNIAPPMGRSITDVGSPVGKSPEKTV